MLINVNAKVQNVARLEVFTAMTIRVVVFWVIARCCEVVGKQCFGELCCLHLHDSDQNYVCVVLDSSAASLTAVVE
jgi:hypothetical protein